MYLSLSCFSCVEKQEYYDDRVQIMLPMMMRALSALLRAFCCGGGGAEGSNGLGVDEGWTAEVDFVAEKVVASALILSKRLLLSKRLRL